MQRAGPTEICRVPERDGAVELVYSQARERPAVWNDSHQDQIACAALAGELIS
jgi:hypothetical protein